MTSIICALIAACATIICAILANIGAKMAKKQAEDSAKSEARAAERAQESRLQLQLISANMDLTVGVAMALKNGHCNGEVEAGLKAVKEAKANYEQFLDGIALQHLTK